MDDGAKGWVNSRSPLAEKELVSGKYHIKVIVYKLNSAVRQSLDVNGLVQYKTEVAKFSADQTSISKNNSIKFTFTPASHDSKQPVSYLWEISLLNDNAKKKSTNSVITSNEQEPVILFDNPGSYTVQLTVTYANGTSSTFKKENYILITDSTMNIEEVSSSKSDILVYPNPTATVFKVKLNPNQTQGKIQILSLNGTILTSTEFANTDNPEVNIQALPSGIYIVKIISNHQVYTKKVTKK
jgi:PKD repeat protein